MDVAISRSRADSPRTYTYRGSATMVYSECGPLGSTVYVLVHGIGMGRAVFADLAAQLSRHGHVVGLDLPGFGDSPQPRRRLTMGEAGDLLAEFVQQMRGSWVSVNPEATSSCAEGRTTSSTKIVLIGHSMGTEVVAEAIARHPGVCDAAVLIAPTINRAERTAHQQVLRLLQDLYGESPKVLVKGMLEYLKASPRWLLQVLGDMLTHHIEETLPRVTVPTLVMRGSDDRVCPREWVQEVAACVPHSVYREAEGRGHEAMIRNGHPVSDLIVEFLSASAPHA